MFSIKKQWVLLIGIGAAAVLAAALFSLKFANRHSAHLSDEPQSAQTSNNDYSADASNDAGTGVAASNLIQAGSKTLESKPRHAVLTTDFDSLSLNDRKALMQSRKAKISALMKEMALHRSDPEKLAAIDAEIKRYIENYNQLLLPVALAEIEAAEGKKDKP